MLASNLQRKAARRRAAPKRLERTPGKASSYIHHLDELLISDALLPVVLYGRVSRRHQQSNSNLDDQIEYEREQLQLLRVVLIEVFDEVGSGWDGDRQKLEAAAEYARCHDAVLIARSTCRIIRSIDYRDDRDPDVLPTDREYRELLRLLGDVTLATRLHPDASWIDVRRVETLQGQAMKGRKGGRPKKKSRGCYMPRATDSEKANARTLRAEGHSIREIGRKLQRPHSTIQEWL